jgi:hypothetical protein
MHGPNICNLEELNGLETFGVLLLGIGFPK